MKRIIPLLITFLAVAAFHSSCTTRAREFTVAFYNVENLFDTEDDPATDDADFLPDSRIPWTPDRYAVKLQHLAQVLSSLDDELPAVIGLCEVENARVLQDLTGQKELKKGSYDIVHFDSPDERGIDNALLYRKSEFKVIDQKPISIHLTLKPEDATRDILYVKGIVKRSPGDTLHLFVNHWPSRRGGASESEQHRMDAALTLKTQVDSLFTLDPGANIIIMGDLNDEPFDQSVVNGLGALSPTRDPKPSSLYNLMASAAREGKGTIYYNQWQVFDHMIVSDHLISKTSGLTLAEPEGKIFSPDWILFKPENGPSRPDRTSGKEYYGGYSDHLPVFLEFSIR